MLTTPCWVLSLPIVGVPRRKQAGVIFHAGYVDCTYTCSRGVDGTPE